MVNLLACLKYGKQHPSIRQSNLWSALRELERANLLDSSTARHITRHYDFLRTLESRQRIVQNQSLDSLPDTPEDMIKLVRRMGYRESDPVQAVTDFKRDLEERRQEMRTIFLEVVEKERG